jgi:hypothetical protein
MGDPATMAAQTTVVQFPYTESVSALCLIHCLLLISLGRRREIRDGTCCAGGKTIIERKETTGYAGQSQGGKGTSRADGQS